MSISLLLLLGWHVYLILSGQTTIDVYQNRERASEARRRGQKFVNAFDLGPKRNWQECFDVHGKWWWLTWMLPPTKPKKGNGVILPTIYHSNGGHGKEHEDSVEEYELGNTHPEEMETGTLLQTSNFELTEARPRRDS